MSLLLELGDGGALGGNIVPDAADPAIAILLETSAGVWRDISADFVSGSIRRGKQRELDDYQPGTSSLLFNNTSRQYDPSNTAGPYYGSILPMKRLWVLASWAGITYSKFFGYTDRWIQTKQGPHHGTTTVTATDAFKVLNRNDLPESVWAQEVATDAPLLWWQLNEPSGSTVVFDALGGVQLATFGAPTLGATGLVNHSSSTALSIADTTSGFAATGNYLPAATTTVTLEAIVKTTATTGTILSVSNPGLGDGQRFRLYLNAGVATFGVGKTSSSNIQETLAGNVAVNDGNPHHIVGVFNSADAAFTMRSYVDGVETAGNNNPGGTFRGDQEIVVGNAADGFGSPSAHAGGVIGTVDEAAVYTSVLSATRIAAHYSARATPWNGDLSGTRVGRVLDLAAFPSVMRTIAAGKSTLQSADLDMTALTHLQKVAQSEFGNLYISAAGYVVFEQRTDQINQPTLGTFSYDGGGGLGFETTSPEIADDLIRNKVTISRSGGVAQTVKDAASITAYQTASYSRDGLYHNSDSLSRDAASFFVSEYKTPIERVNQLTINPYADPTNLFPQALGRELTDKISLIEKPQGVGSAVTRTLIIEGIADTFTAKQWKTVFNLSPAFAGAFLQLDNSTITIEGANPGRIFF